MKVLKDLREMVNEGWPGGVGGKMLLNLIDVAEAADAYTAALNRDGHGDTSDLRNALARLRGDDKEHND